MDYKLITAIGSGIIAGACLMIWIIVQVRDRIGNPTVKDARRDCSLHVGSCKMAGWAAQAEV